jgi:hypothetical protein
MSLSIDSGRKPFKGERLMMAGEQDSGWGSIEITKKEGENITVSKYDTTE